MWHYLQFIIHRVQISSNKDSFEPNKQPNPSTVMFVFVVFLAILASQVGAIEPKDVSQFGSLRPNLATAPSNSVIVLLNSGVNGNKVQESLEFNLFNLSKHQPNDKQPIDSAAITIVEPESFFALAEDSAENSDLYNETKPQNDHKPNQPMDHQQQAVPKAREARKMNLFNGFWNKPRISPLYLINGTVCRFVNAAPICTTLSTQGLLRK